MKQFKKIFSFLAGYRKMIRGVILLTALDVIGTVSLPYIMSLVIDHGIGKQNMQYLFSMGGLMLAVTVATCLFGSFSRKLAGTLAAGLGDNIRKAMTEKLCAFSSGDLDAFSKASFINRMTVDISNIQETADILFGIVLSAPLTILCIILMTYNINRELSVIFLASVPLFALTAYILVKMSLPYYAKNASSQDDMNRSLLEDLVSIKLVKAFVRENFMLEKYKEKAKKVNYFGQTAEQITNLNQPIGSLVTNLCIVLLLWFGGQKIIGGTIEVGQLFTLVTYTNQILYQVTLISTMVIPVMGSLVSVERVLEVLDKEPSIEDQSAESGLEVKDGSLRLNHVWFDYHPDSRREDMLLQDITLEIKDGEAIGIVGPTGAGKTTLINLIPRLLDAAEGEIIIGGIDSKALSLKNLRKALSFAPQRSILFTGTLRENLKCGYPEATEEDMKKALQDACIYPEVMSHPEGLDMPIEEGGGNVSGGQRQRLCLARAFIKRSKVLIMDDCTSALDKATERAVIDHIVNDCTDRTRILISGKISSIRRMDRIIIVDKGRIAATGTHEELKKSSAVYAELCKSQGEL